jgi:hypothetical protein
MYIDNVNDNSLAVSNFGDFLLRRMRAQADESDNALRPLMSDSGAGA